MPITFTHPVTTESITINIQPGSVVISPRFGESYSFDRAGRLLSLFVDGRSLQRTLDHRLLVRRKEGPTRRRELPAAERNAILHRVFATLHGLEDALSTANLPAPDRAAIQSVLATILRMGPDALPDDAAAYRGLFLPVSILPPDQYLALVVQATIGCSWNKCTFCGLYRDRQFRVRGVDEFRAHCTAVRDYFGAGLSLRRGIFLADANALTVPQARLLELVQAAQAVFQRGATPHPLFSFISAFDAQRKQPADWATLRDLGLSRVYIGLESGDDELLQFVQKPGDAAAAVDAVTDIKAGGIGVGVIAMVGLGGDRFAAQHVANTVRTISAMPLDSADVIYLSAYRPARHTEYPQQVQDAGITPLTPEQEKTQQRALQDALRTRFPQVRVAPYHVSGFAL
jgi:radical SAM superfamily enzyme YgiQ (UPF0313 family)